jgi:hypothetical protein
VINAVVWITRRRVGPERAADFGLRAHVDHTSITPKRATPVRRQGAHQLRLNSFAPAAFDDALQQFALTFGVRDGLAGIPLPPRDPVHQRQPLLHEA